MKKSPLNKVWLYHTLSCRLTVDDLIDHRLKDLPCRAPGVFPMRDPCTLWGPTLQSSRSIPHVGSLYSLGIPGWSGWSWTMPRHATIPLLTQMELVIILRLKSQTYNEYPHCSIYRALSTYIYTAYNFVMNYNVGNCLKTHMWLTFERKQPSSTNFCW